MEAPMKKLAAGNWKMNGTLADLAQAQQLMALHPSAGCEIVLCPPSTLLAPMAAATKGTPLLLGGQDCHHSPSGAHTGDISAQMLVDAGARYVILGHSERRADHGEADALIAQKVQSAWRAALIAIVCVGETEAQRDADTTLDIIAGQLAKSVPDNATSANVVIAYEPVWAIGTGRTPSLTQIAQVHDHIRALLTSRFGVDASQMRLLYGGSVKPNNAVEIFAVSNVDGALVGGASLKAQDFAAIVSALSE
jgi:triosephosphate isomerase